MNSGEIYKCICILDVVDTAWIEYNNGHIFERGKTYEYMYYSINDDVFYEVYHTGNCYMDFEDGDDPYSAFSSYFQTLDGYRESQINKIL